MFPWSVMPNAGCPSPAAAATASVTRAAPSNMENSVWVWRWTNERFTWSGSNRFASGSSSTSWHHGRNLVPTETERIT